MAAEAQELCTTTFGAPKLKKAFKRATAKAKELQVLSMDERDVENKELRPQYGKDLQTQELLFAAKTIFILELVPDVETDLDVLADVRVDPVVISALHIFRQFEAQNQPSHQSESDAETKNAPPQDPPDDPTFAGVNPTNPNFTDWLNMDHDALCFKIFSKEELITFYREVSLNLVEWSKMPERKGTRFSQEQLFYYKLVTELATIPVSERLREIDNNDLLKAGKARFMLQFMYTQEEIADRTADIEHHDDMVESIFEVLMELNKLNGDWHKILTSKERAAQNEESPEWQAQLELIHDLIQPVMARMNEIRKQEVATEQDLDRPKLLFTEYKNFKDAGPEGFAEAVARLWCIRHLWGVQDLSVRYPALKKLDIDVLDILAGLDAKMAPDEDVPPALPQQASKMMEQKPRGRKEKDNYELVALDEKAAESSKLYKGGPSRFCRIESITILRGDRKVPFDLPVPAILGQNPDTNLEFKIHGDPVAHSVKLIASDVVACSEAEQDRDTKGYKKLHTSVLQFFPGGCHGHELSGLENFKFDIVDFLEWNRGPPANDEAAPVNDEAAPVNDEAAPVNDEEAPGAGDLFHKQTDTQIMMEGVHGEAEGSELDFDDILPDQVPAGRMEILMEFDTHGGIGHQLDFTLGRDVSTGTGQVLGTLSCLEARNEPFKAHVRIRIPHGLDAKKDGPFLEALIKLRDDRSAFPYSGYCVENKLTPLTQMGMFPTRERVRNAHGGLVKIDQQYSFSSIPEWRIFQANAAHLEYQLEKVRINEVNDGYHQVAFFKVSDKTILAGVQLEETMSSDDQYYITPGSDIKLRWTVPAALTKGAFSCNGTVLENIFGIAGKYIIVSLNARRTKESQWLKDQAPPLTSVSRTHYEATVTFTINTSPVKYRVDAINKIGDRSMERFHEAILARNTSSYASFDPVQKASASLPSGNKLFQDILLSDAFNWNEDQRNFFNVIRALPARVAIMEGVPGSGKSRLIAGFVQLFCGLKNEHGSNSTCVLVQVPTNAAGDSVHEAIQKFNKLTDASSQVIRVYTQANEVKAFMKKGAAITTEEAAADHASITLIQAIATLSEAYDSNRHALAEDSLEAHIIRAAQNAENDPDSYCDRLVSSGVLRRISKSLNRPLDYLDRLPEDPAELFQVDLYPMILSYIARMRRQDVNEWESSEIKELKLVFGWVMEEVLSNTQVVIATPYCCGSDILSKKFGENYNHIMVIEDESFRQMEIDTMLPLGKLRNNAKILGLVLCGDTHQPRPFSLSNTGVVRYNEFGSQLGLSFGRRLINSAHPQTAQYIQNRMVEVLTDLPNRRTYGRRMQTSEIASRQVVNAKWNTMMTEMLPASFNANNYVVISIEGSQDYLPPGLTSRQNPIHAEYIVHLVISNYKADGYQPKEILVIAFYREQVRYIHELFLRAVREKLIKLEQIPMLMTTTKAQGWENLWVIADVVVSKSDEKSELGFVGREEALFNVFLTRAKHAFTGLAHRELGSGKIALDEKQDRYVCKFVRDASRRGVIWDVSERPAYLACLGVKTVEEIETENNLAAQRSSEDDGWGNSEQPFNDTQGKDKQRNDKQGNDEQGNVEQGNHEPGKDEQANAEWKVEEAEGSWGSHAALGDGENTQEGTW